MFMNILEAIADEKLNQETPESIADQIVQNRERGHRLEDLQQRADQVLRQRGQKPHYSEPKELSDSFECDLIKQIAGGMAANPDATFNEGAARVVVEFAMLIRQAYQHEINARAEAGEKSTPDPATSGSKQCGEGTKAES